MNVSNQVQSSWVVYMHTNRINGKKYIGITSKHPNERWRDGKGYQGGSFRSAIDKYGWDNFAHELLFEGLTEIQAKQKEKELIALYKTNHRDYGYNLTDGGDGVLGLRHTDITREKMSRSHAGHIHSEETKRKMSEAAKGNQKWLGKHHTDMSKDKISDSLISYYAQNPVADAERVERSIRAMEYYIRNPSARERLSRQRKQYFVDNPEARREMSRRRLEYYREHPDVRQKLSDAHKKPVEMIDMHGDAIAVYDSLTDAQNATGIDRSSIARVCSGKQKTAGGRSWRYYIDQ